MSSEDYINKINFERLLKIYSKPIKNIINKPFVIKKWIIETDLNDKQFQKTIEQTTTYYE